MIKKNSFQVTIKSTEEAGSNLEQKAVTHIFGVSSKEKCVNIPTSLTFQEDFHQHSCTFYRFKNRSQELRSELFLYQLLNLEKKTSHSSPVNDLVIGLLQKMESGQKE